MRLTIKPLLAFGTVVGTSLCGVLCLLFGFSAERGGISLGNQESEGKRKSGLARRGNSSARWPQCEFARAVARMRCALKAKFESLALRQR